MQYTLRPPHDFWPPETTQRRRPPCCRRRKRSSFTDLSHHAATTRTTTVVTLHPATIINTVTIITTAYIHHPTATTAASTIDTSSISSPATLLPRHFLAITTANIHKGCLLVGKWQQGAVFGCRNHQTGCGCFRAAAIGCVWLVSTPLKGAFGSTTCTTGAFGFVIHAPRVRWVYDIT
ncbi:hypothetical protein Tco_0797175 [Tanacetum coccineum]